MNQNGHVLLNDIQANALGHEQHEARHQLVEARVTAKAVQRLAPPLLVTAHARLRHLLEVDLLLDGQVMGRQRPVRIVSTLLISHYDKNK